MTVIQQIVGNRLASTNCFTNPRAYTFQLNTETISSAVEPQPDAQSEKVNFLGQCLSHKYLSNPVVQKLGIKLADNVFKNFRDNELVKNFADASFLREIPITRTNEGFYSMINTYSEAVSGAISRSVVVVLKNNVKINSVFELGFLAVDDKSFASQYENLPSVNVNCELDPKKLTISLLLDGKNESLVVRIPFDPSIYSNSPWIVPAKEAYIKVLNIAAAIAILEQAVQRFPLKDRVKTLILEDMLDEVAKDPWSVLSNQYLKRIIELEKSDRQIEFLANVSEQEIVKALWHRDYDRKITKQVDKAFEKSVNETGINLRSVSGLSDKEFEVLFEELQKAIIKCKAHPNLGNFQCKSLAYQLIAEIIKQDDYDQKVNLHMTVLGFLKDGSSVQEILDTF